MNIRQIFNVIKFKMRTEINICSEVNIIRVIILNRNYNRKTQTLD